MDQRSKNRHQEHDKHGLKNTGKTISNRPNQTLHECPCGWSGWLDTTDAD